MAILGMQVQPKAAWTPVLFHAECLTCDLEGPGNPGSELEPRRLAFSSSPSVSV